MLVLAPIVGPPPLPPAGVVDVVVACGLQPPFVTPTLRFVELLFDALPVVALPPDVLPDVVALPLDEVCTLVFETPITLVFVTVHEVLALFVHVLVEPGPVVDIVQVAAEADPAKSSGLTVSTASIDSIPRMMIPPSR